MHPSLRRSVPSRLVLPLVSALLAAPLAGQETTFRGAILYEKVPATRDGLRLDETVRTPAPGILVEIVDAPSREVLGSGFTNRKGNYSIPVALGESGEVYVRALAQTENASVVRVEDQAELSIVSPAFAAARGGTAHRDLLATDDSRMAGAFNIAVTIWRANQLVHAAHPGVELPRVEVRWDTAYADGTFFRDRAAVAYINGRRDEDSDEFDDHVIAHEYGHFLMARFSRESSPGGAHGFGEQLDPRLAWSEGWGNFFSAATTGRAGYIDTGIVRGRQGVIVTFDLEQDVPPGDRPGFWSEHSVSSLLWDWFDDGAEEGDSLALGFEPLWRGLVALAKHPEPWVLPFADAVAEITGEHARLAGSLAVRRIAYEPGQSAAAHPFPEPLPSGRAVTGTVDSRATRRSNLWGSSRHYWFRVPQAGRVTLTMKITDADDSDRADLDLYLFDEDGEAVGRSIDVNGVGDAERIAEDVEPGYYRVEVRSWASSDGGRLGDRNAHQGKYTLTARY